MFPTGGMHNIGDDSLRDLINHLVLPVITIGLYNTAIFTNYVESSVSEQLKKQYVITARAKGLSEKIEKVHKLLIDTGFWHYTKNPHPARHGLSTQSAREVLPPPPEEERTELSTVFSR